MTPLPFVDLQTPAAEMAAEIAAALAKVAAGGHYVLGPEVTAFEQEWAAWCEAKHAVGVANCLDALAMGLAVCGVGPGDEVIVPSNTYIATWLAISQVGATPVPVEPDEGTCNLDPRLVERAITNRTKAVMPVHLYGLPADLGPLLALSRAHGLKVVEDAAQSHGARYHGRRIGGHGDVICWSFYPTKNLGALGDGGAITTDDPALADAIRVMRNYGARQRYVCEVAGRNSRLDELHAAVLRLKLRRLDGWNRTRQQLARRYRAAFADLALRLQDEPAGCESVAHLFTVRTPQRLALQKHLEAHGVPTIIHYPIPPHRQGAYAHLGFATGSFPIAERIHNTVLSLPLHPYLSDTVQDRIIAAVRAWQPA